MSENNALKPQEQDRQNADNITRAVGLAVIGYITLSVGLPLLWRLITQNTQGVVGMSVTTVQILGLILSLARYSVAVLLPFGFAAFILKRNALTATPKKQWSPPLLVVLLAVVGIGSFGSVISAVLQNLLEGLGIYVSTATPPLYDTLPVSIITFLGYTLIVAVVEEIAFRGFLLKMLLPIGERYAVICSAALFALCHGSVLQVVPAFLSGLFLGWIVCKTGSIVMAVGGHMLYNGVALGVNLMTAEMQPMARNLLSYSIGGVFSAVGLGCLFILWVMWRRKRPRTLPTPYFYCSPMLLAAVILLIVRIVGGVAG